MVRCATHRYTVCCTMCVMAAEALRLAAAGNSGGNTTHAARMLAGRTPESFASNK